MEIILKKQHQWHVSLLITTHINLYVLQVELHVEI